MTGDMPGIPQVMKYIVLALIVAYIVVLMLFTSGSNRPFEEVEAEIGNVIDTSALTKVDAQRLKRNFGLNSADYAGVMYYTSESSMSVDEVLLIRVRREDQIQEITDALDERISSRSSAFEEYAPEAVQLLKEAQRSVRGKYIFFAVSPDAGEYRAVFDRSL